LQRLSDNHQVMLALVAAHELQTSRTQPDPLELTRLRLEMMKVHRRRMVQLEAIALMGGRLPPGGQEQIEQFRREDVEMTALASRHVVEWPVDRIVREWNLYREVATHNYSWQRDRIAREAALLSSLSDLSNRSLPPSCRSCRAAS